MMDAKTRRQGSDEWKAEMAFQVFSLLIRARDADPTLNENTYFDALLREAHGDFHTAFARIV